MDKEMPTKAPSMWYYELARAAHLVSRLCTATANVNNCTTLEPVEISYERLLQQPLPQLLPPLHSHHQDACYAPTANSQRTNSSTQRRPELSIPPKTRCRFRYDNPAQLARRRPWHFNSTDRQVRPKEAPTSYPRSSNHSTVRKVRPSARSC